MSADTIPPRTTREQLMDQFDASAERINATEIYVINPDEINQVAALADSDARELPDGLYVVDEAIRDRLGEVGVDYEGLSRAVVFGINGATGDEIETGQAGLSKQNSAHHVFAARLNLQRPGVNEGLGLAIFVKAHKEVDPEHAEKAKSAKPFRELGTLAMLQDEEMRGVYEPVGILKSGDVKFVMTAHRTGVTTLDDHGWYGRGKEMSSPERRAMNKEQRDALHSRDVELIGRAFELFGAIHAQGIFHGDGQAKNIGWSLRDTSGDAPEMKELTSTADLAGVNLTIVDMENATVFQPDPETGESSPEYLKALLGTDDQLSSAVRDIVQFLGSIPKLSRTVQEVRKSKKSHPTNRDQPEVATDSYDELFVELYITAFLEQRKMLHDDKLLESDLEQAEQIRTQLEEVLPKIDDPGVRKRWARYEIT